jgi:hypothetical protein
VVLAEVVVVVLLLALPLASPCILLFPYVEAQVRSRAAVEVAQMSE